jgi:peptidoglycan/LPS O-acetylase OafA/YrhL
VRTLDRIFGWLMVTLSFAQLALSIVTMRSNPELMLWATGACLAELLLGACHLMRAERPHDTTLARVCVMGSVAWLVVMGLYLLTYAKPTVPITQAVVTAVLLLLSLRTRNRSRPM